MMLISRRAVESIALAIVMLVPAGDAFACSCPPSGPSCQNAFQVDAVFAGTVHHITELRDDETPLQPGETRLPRAIRVGFSGVVGYRGIATAVATVLTAGSEPACGYRFKQGERYLVYATRSDDGSGFVTGICSRTRLVADAGEDLDFLETLARPGTARARIFGTITHWERDLATLQPLEHGPVEGVLVTVRGLANADASTDALGHYEVAVPPGDYEITAWPRAGFSARGLVQTARLPDARACFVADFGVTFDGRIRGIVRQSTGEPAAGVPIEAMAADGVRRSGVIEVIRTSTDPGGRFEFTDVGPGRYVVGVDLTRRMDAKVVFPTTFHPGTADLARATVVQLEGGQQRDLKPMTLPPARPSYQLIGTVVFEDGRPAAGAFVSLSDGAAPHRQVAVGRRVGPDGAFSFDVHEGLGYVAQASYWDEAQRMQVRGRAGPFVVAGATEPLKLVLTAR
jgi:hypothetical protein